MYGEDIKGNVFIYKQSDLTIFIGSKIKWGTMT